MNSRELLFRLRAGFKAGELRAGKAEWLGDAAAPPFQFRGKWGAPAASGARESWRVSFSCHHKTVIIEAKKPRARLQLVRSQAS